MTQPLDLDAIDAVVRNAAQLGADIDSATATALVAEVRRLRARIDRAQQAMAERLAEVAEREADGMLPFGTPGASWCDAVTVTCARIDDALRDLPEHLHATATAPRPAADELQVVTEPAAARPAAASKDGQP